MNFRMNHKGFAAPLVIAIGALVIAVVAGVVGYSLKSTPKPSPNPTPQTFQTQPTPTLSSVDETANWETYTAGNFFTIRYPKDRYKENPFDTGPFYTVPPPLFRFSIESAHLPPSMVIPETAGIRIYFTAYMNENNLPLNNPKDAIEARGYMMGWISGGAPESLYSKDIKEMIIGGTRAYYYFDEVFGSDSSCCEKYQARDIITIRNDKIYHILILPAGRERGPVTASESNDIEKILSTFQFSN